MNGSARGDLADRSDVVELLGDFYNRAFRDDLLRPVFVDVAQMDLAEHLPAITDFWCKAVLKEGEYRRNVFEPHRELHALVPLEPKFFERWLTLWHSTIDDRHTGARADLAKLQGARIALSMCRMLTGERVDSIAGYVDAHSPPSRCRTATRAPRDP